MQALMRHAVAPCLVRNESTIELDLFCAVATLCCVLYCIAAGADVGAALTPQAHALVDKVHLSP